ncbi:MAG: carboxypeptidase regulatory-like domain-containing protein, partial [Gemmatimonadaceae bacterium]
MISKTMTAIALMLCATLAENVLGAQERGIVAVKVRSATGDSLPFARLRAKGAKTDTVVRVKNDGNANFVLPFGGYHLTVNMIGYKPTERDIDVKSGDTRMEVTLERVAQQLATVDVNANWIGIHGVVGDSGVMRTLDHTTVRTPSGDRKVVTDSLGRFTVRLDKAEQVVLRFEHDGYRSQTMVVNVEPGKTPDIVALLNPGKERNSVKIDMMELG